MLMKNLKIFLLLILGLLANIPVVAQDDIVNDYMVDFNSPITTNTSPHGAENRDFIVSSGWGHLVGMQEIGAGNVPTYVPYTYNATGGVVPALFMTHGTRTMLTSGTIL